MDIASEQVGKTLTKIESQRFQRSYKNLIMKPDYNKFSDENCKLVCNYCLIN